ncbi:hypothetical protein MRX96_031001 [Rhipicephalus microplus]
MVDDSQNFPRVYYSLCQGRHDGVLYQTQFPLLQTCTFAESSGLQTSGQVSRSPHTQGGALDDLPAPGCLLPMTGLILAVVIQLGVSEETLAELLADMFTPAAPRQSVLLPYGFPDMHLNACLENHHHNLDKGTDKAVGMRDLLLQFLRKNVIGEVLRPTCSSARVKRFCAVQDLFGIFKVIGDLFGDQRLPNICPTNHFTPVGTVIHEHSLFDAYEFTT